MQQGFWKTSDIPFWALDVDPKVLLSPRIKNMQVLGFQKKQVIQS
jgi:hypothetical protein